jgi:hypothetical protein
VNDAERLRHDPAMRWIVGGKAAHSDAASPSQMGRFETQWLAAPANLSALADLSGQWIELVHGRRPPRGIVLDMDSSVSPTHGEQEMSVWNGHYACACYHPLFVFNQFGDLERSALNVHSADGWDGVFKPVVSGRTRPQCPRSTSSWKPSGSKSFQHRIGYLLERPVGRPSNGRRFHANFTYQLSPHACNTGADQGWSLRLKEELVKIGAKVWPRTLCRFKWRRSPSHDKCSRRFCGRTRYVGKLDQAAPGHRTWRQSCSKAGKARIFALV